MRQERNFEKRIGAVRLPQAAEALGETDEERRNLETRVAEVNNALLPLQPLEPIFPRFRFCSTNLKQGCYTVSFRPKGTGIFGPSFRGTLRVQNTGSRRIISGDLYRFSLFLTQPITPVLGGILANPDADLAADTGGTIPIFRRRNYFSYLKGTSAQLFTLVFGTNPCRFTLNFDEFEYQHPASGFDGQFGNSPNRSIRWVLNHTSDPDLFTGQALEGSNELGTVSIRWVSSFYRRATLEIQTLQGAQSPPQSVPGSGGMAETFRTVFLTANWDLTVNFAGAALPLPGSLAGVQNPNQCWSQANLATLMASVPGYNPNELDSVWKAYLLAVPARLGCSRGIMFDSGFGDPNDVDREGAATFSHDGYPAADGVNYGAATNQQQRNVPRAFLRSAAHEVGHTFNQIHQGFEAGNDNSIMTPTPSVAAVLSGSGGSFPNDINLAFNETVRQHLIHLPDPAVRPGAMEFFGAAVSAPQAQDVNFVEELDVQVQPASESVNLGEPLALRWAIRNNGNAAVPLPADLDPQSLSIRVNVTDPLGNITFMRPLAPKACPSIHTTVLEPGKAAEGEMTLFWGRDGFAFEQPGKHSIEVILLWNMQGGHFAASGEAAVWVAHPLTDEDNQIASLLLDHDVGRAVASKEGACCKEAADRIAKAASLKKAHPACKALAERGLVPSPKKGKPSKKPKGGKGKKG